MLDQFGINYWAALLLAPLVVGILGMVIERLFLKQDGFAVALALLGGGAVFLGQVLANVLPSSGHLRIQ